MRFLTGDSMETGEAGGDDGHCDGHSSGDCGGHCIGDDGGDDGGDNDSDVRVLFIFSLSDADFARYATPCVSERKKKTRGAAGKKKIWFREREWYT